MADIAIILTNGATIEHTVPGDIDRIRDDISRAISRGEAIRFTDTDDANTYIYSPRNVLSVVVLPE